MEKEKKEEKRRRRGAENTRTGARRVSRVHACRAMMRLHLSVFSITEHSGAIKSHDAEQRLL